MIDPLRMIIWPQMPVTGDGVVEQIPIAFL